MATATPSKSTKRKSTSAGPRRSTTTVKTTVKTAASKAVAEDIKTTSASATVTEPTTSTSVASAPTSDDDRLKRPDLIEAVAKRVSLKRSEAKMVFDVVLDEIGKALDVSDEVVVPPLGKLMVKKRLEKPGGDMLTLKLKRAEADPAAGDVAPLAEPKEDS